MTRRGVPILNDSKNGCLMVEKRCVSRVVGSIVGRRNYIKSMELFMMGPETTLNNLYSQVRNEQTQRAF
jgi:hypothetical protein